jgi:hypothetical protein
VGRDFRSFNPEFVHLLGQIARNLSMYGRRHRLGQLGTY